MRVTQRRSCAAAAVRCLRFVAGGLVFALATSALSLAQAGGAGSVSGTVTDPAGGAIAGATVTLTNSVSGFTRTAATDKTGTYNLYNVPFNPYLLTVSAKGFAPFIGQAVVRSTVPVSMPITLKLAGGKQTVTVRAQASTAMVENSATNHTDISRAIISKLPLESQSSSLSSLVTLVAPGVTADSNGLFHGLGDHASNSFSIDGQPISDQQSKVFSNQLPANAVQSLSVIEGAPPAQYGDKTSLVIVTTTRSGQGDTTPHGDIQAGYGMFGTSTELADLAYGGTNWGNFISLSGLNTGRFLDGPEFNVYHDHGNEENVFDHVDYQFSSNNLAHMDLEFTRSWFQNPNSFDAQFHPGLVNNVTGGPFSAADQRSQIVTYNIYPSFTHLMGPSALFKMGAWLRRDDYNYYPSGNPLNDYSPDLTSESVAQTRFLTNAGAEASYSYVSGIHNFRAGASFQHWLLNENDHLGIVDPALNAVCFSADGSPNTNPSVTSATQCGGPLDVGGSANPAFNPLLACYDLTRPTPAGSDGCPSPTSFDYLFRGNADIKEAALYAQDDLTVGNWTVNLGVREDLYRGFTSSNMTEPRLGAAYHIKRTNTVVNFFYARAMETPFNENLIIASTGCSNPVIAALVPPPGVTCTPGPLAPGVQNSFHAGLQQAFGRYLVLSGDYQWVYTSNAFDFGVVGASPIYFPIEWQKSKEPGFVIRATVPNFHGVAGYTTLGHVAARFFAPQAAGIPIIPPFTGVFRIDHDESVNSTTHIQYQPSPKWPWIGFNWRYDSGLVAGATPCYNPGTATCAPTSTTLNGQPAIAMLNANTGLPLTADQEFEGGFTCNGVGATPTTPLPSTCLASQFSSTLINVPAPGTENDDHNPQRIAPRSLFDVAVGDDNLFAHEAERWSLRFTVVNILNTTALYNFLSTFSGTHYVAPRTMTMQLGFHF
jgi:hypothetical protein